MLQHFNQLRCQALYLFLWKNSNNLKRQFVFFVFFIIKVFIYTHSFHYTDPDLKKLARKNLESLSVIEIIFLLEIQ